MAVVWVWLILLFSSKEPWKKAALREKKTQGCTPYLK